MSGWDGEWSRLQIGLDPDVYAELKALVGSRKVSPTIRAMVEQWVDEERVRRKVEQMREAGQ